METFRNSSPLKSHQAPWTASPKQTLVSSGQSRRTYFEIMETQPDMLEKSVDTDLLLPAPLTAPHQLSPPPAGATGLLLYFET